MTFRRAIAGALAALCCAGASTAHPMIIQTGVIEAVPDGVRITIPIDDHTLEHEKRCFGDDITRQSLAEILAGALAMHDAAGARVPARAISADPVEGSIALLFETGALNLSLALRFPPEHLACPRQLQLRTASDIDARSDLLQLTTAGNVEVLRRVGAGARALVHVPESQIPLLTLDPAPAGWRCTITYPALLLRAWTEFADLPPDAMSATWLNGARPDLLAWAEAHFTTSPALDAATPPAWRVDLIVLHDQIADADTRAFNTALAKVRWTVILPTTDAAIESIHWTAFQPGVQRVEAVVTDSEDAKAYISLNATQNSIALP